LLSFDFVEEIGYRLRTAMFTGIIEHLGTIAGLETSPAGGKLSIAAPSLAPHLAVSASVAVNGCCLTVVQRDKEHFFADLSAETIAKTSFAQMKPGVRVNLEQPVAAGKEFGGHFVLGHVDGTGRVTRLGKDGDSWLFGVQIPVDLARYVVAKGSITIDGISLTVSNWLVRKQFSIMEIAVIPFTYEHTNIADRKPGDHVNVEADILGKYIERYLQQRGTAASLSTLSVEELVRQGF